MMVRLQPVLSDSSVGQKHKTNLVAVLAGDTLGRKGLREKSKDEGRGVGKRCAGGLCHGEVLVFTTPWAVTSVAEPSEQCQPAVLAQPLGL